MSQAERLLKLEGWYHQDLGVHPDGNRFLLISQEGTGSGNQMTLVFNWFEELRQLTENRQ